MRHKSLRLVLFIFCSWMSVACGRTSDRAEALPLVATMSVPMNTAIPTLPPAPVETAPLLFWLPVSLTASQDEVAGAIFEQSIRDFENSDPGILVDWRVKAAEGVGGILSTLRNASEVAPAAIPDAMLLRREELLLAAQAGLIHAWPDAPPELLADIPPAALAGGELNGVRYGLPYGLILTHLIYDAEKVPTGTVDFSYAAILERGQSIALPLEKSVPIRELLVAQYAAAREIVDADLAQPYQPAALEELFAFYEFAFSLGIVVSLADGEPGASAWLTTSDEYLRRRADGDTLGFAPIPSIQGAELALVDAWYWVLPNANMERQQIARAFALWMLDAARQSTYLYAVAALPARQSALTAEATGDYERFALAALSRAPQAESVDDALAALILRNFVALAQGEVNTEAALAAIAAQYEPQP